MSPIPIELSLEYRIIQYVGSKWLEKKVKKIIDEMDGMISREGALEFIKKDLKLK